MLTEEEVKELKKLSPELREKVDAMFASPYYLGFEALSSQYQAYCKELKDKPFTIEGTEDFSKYSESENIDKIIMAMSATARAKAETSLKISKEIPDMAEAIVKLQGKLSNDEKMLEDAKTKKKIEKSGTQIAIKRS
jgi:hypothetical protein